VSTQYYDPISKQPFHWDNERKAIYYNIVERADLDKRRDLIYYD